jgi:hypothetical protein
LREGGDCAALVLRLGGGALLASAGSWLVPAAAGEGGLKPLAARPGGEGGEGAERLSWLAEAAGVL